jgi:hypothetical protein
MVLFFGFGCKAHKVFLPLLIRPAARSTTFAKTLQNSHILFGKHKNR